MASTNGKQLPQDDAPAAGPPSTSTAFTEATSAAAAAADAPPFTAVAAASSLELEMPSWARRSSASPPPALPDRPQERGPQPPRAGTRGGSSSYAARVDRKGKKLAHVLSDASGEEGSTSTGSQGSLLRAWPASPIHEVKLLHGKGIWTNDSSCSSSTCAVRNEKKSYDTESTGNLPIQTLQGRSALGSRYWELYDCPANVEGMNPPGFSSPHPVWEGFAVPVKKEGGKLSFFCVACEKLLSGDAAQAQKHMLGTKGCAISEDHKMDLKSRIRKFEDRRTDLKRKRKESKKGIVQDPVRGVIPNNTISLREAEINKSTNDGLDQLPGTTECGSSALQCQPSCGGPEGAKKATQRQLECDQGQVSTSDYCCHRFPTGFQDFFRLVTERWQETEYEHISSFDPLPHSYPTAQSALLCPAKGANEDLFWLAADARQEPDASSSYSSFCSCSRDGTETLTVCPSTGDEGSEAGEEFHQDQVSPLDPLSCSQLTNDCFH